MVDWLAVDIQSLYVTALIIGVVHTLLGPDHYLPFIAIARERNWGNARTLSIAAWCGMGHCAGSVALGLIGVTTGIALGHIEALESVRGTLAAWLLLGFGISYASWSFRTRRRKLELRHSQVHSVATPPDHNGSHLAGNRLNTPLTLTLFIVFLLGPCEALVPLLMYPAAQSNLLAVAAVMATFSLTTIGTMVLIVLFGLKGGKHRLSPSLVGHAGVFTGSVIGLCGVGLLMGL